MIQTKIYRPGLAIPENAGALVHDGDGDGVGAAAIWLIGNPVEYLSITNRRKFDIALVQRVSDNFPAASLAGKKVAVFDLDAESNRQDLEKLADSGADIEFYDHHTRDASILPVQAKVYFQKDDRGNCTATVAYEIAGKQGHLNSTSNRQKAIQLAILGLVNDGKGSAAEKFGSPDVDEETRKSLTKYGRAINFGSGSAMLDSTGLLIGLDQSGLPVQFLRESPEINGLVDYRQKTLDNLMARAERRSFGDIKLYLLPHSSPDDKEIALGAYNDLVTSLMNNDPDHAHVMALQTPDSKWRVAFRSAQGKARIMGGLVSLHYKEEVVGRETAAGFSTDNEINLNDLARYLGG